MNKDVASIRMMKVRTLFPFFFQKQKINPFHGLMLLPKPYGVERKVLVFARVRIYFRRVK